MLITHPVTTKLGSFIPLVMHITWLDFGEILWDSFSWRILFFKILDVFFFKVKRFCPISGMVGLINVKQKRNCIDWTLGELYDLDLWPHSWPGPWIFQGQIQNSCISGIVGLIVKWKGIKLIRYWADCMTLPFDHTHDLDLEVSRSNFEIALSQEWDGWLTWNERDVSHLFMTMILTFVWPWWGGWIYRIVTRLTSDVGLRLTYLVRM